MMSKTIQLASLLMATAATSAGAQTQAPVENLDPAADLSSLREQIAEMKRQAQIAQEQSNKQIELLQNRLEKIETDARAAATQAATAPAKAPVPVGPVADATPKSKKWYDTISLRGYTQLRYNRLLETNSDLQSPQGDRSIGDNNGLFLRRARLVISGQLSQRVSFYIQPDFATAAASDNQNFAQLRDAYFDVGLDNKSEYRLRFGQSKIPYSFENLQSSSNRLPLDRNDALNSAIPNERDLGVMLYWAPDKIRQRFSYLTNSGLKGSGDYGVVGLGVYNGQTLNRPEANNGQHFVARVTYPFLLGKKQIFEPSLQAYTGRYRIPTNSISQGVGVRPDRNYLDERVAAGFTLYPQPFGVQAEYNVGRGPEFDKNTDRIESKNLRGGYLMLFYRQQLKGDQTLIPFARYQRYNGGKKQELDARSYDVRELEFGAEWQLSRQVEFTAQYTIADRRYEDFVKQNNRQRGNLLRLQAQFNY